MDGLLGKNVLYAAAFRKCDTHQRRHRAPSGLGGLFSGACNRPDHVDLGVSVRTLKPIFQQNSLGRTVFQALTWNSFLMNSGYTLDSLKDFQIYL